MRIRARLLLVVGAGLMVTIVAVGGLLSMLTWRGMLTQAESQAQLIAGLLAQSQTMSEQVTAEVDAILDREMIAQALLASHLADIADRAGLDNRELNQRLAEIAARSAIDEIWISDSRGRLRAGGAADATDDEPMQDLTGLPPEGVAQLLAGTRFAMRLGLGQARLGGAPTRYAGVGGVDGPRVVVVGRHQRKLAHLHRTLGAQQVAEALLRAGAVEALFVFDAKGQPVTLNMLKGAAAGGGEITDAEARKGRAVLGGTTAGDSDLASVFGRWISVAAPIPDAYGMPAGAVVARVSTASFQAMLRDYARLGGLACLLIVLAGLGWTVYTSDLISAPLLRIAQAAKEVDARSFVAGSLAKVAARRDELGHLARTFDSMAVQIFAREAELEHQVETRTAELKLRNDQLDQANRRMEADLELAKLMQATILPSTFPADRHWSGSARMTPALQMSGDFYDYFALDEHRTALVIADVSGKGVAPAFFMAVSRTALREAAARHADPGMCLAAVNDLLCEQNPLDLFVTVFYAILDERDGTVAYANGGHNPPYLVASADRIDPLPMTDGMALGVMPGLDYASARIALKPGEILFLFTDGISEAMNAGQEEFGTTRLERVLAETADNHVDAVLARVGSAVQTFVGEAPQSDDITCLVVRYLGSPSVTG